ncbi:HPr family phosphocarrier protein [Curtobacterium flaccumfaciens]|nr:HPr family phosphocarrier protein [Curtobacterium flaccumfaciens]
MNETGLHARPAAEFVKTAAKYDASVHVNGVDAKSLLAIMALALPKGATVSIDATGRDAQAAVDALVRTGPVRLRRVTPPPGESPAAVRAPVTGSRPCRPGRGPRGRR